MAEEGVEPKKGVAGTAARWSGLLGVAAAAAILVLVPVSIDTDAVLSNPGVAYYTAELRVFLAISAVLLVAVTGMIVFDRRPLVVPVLVPVLALLAFSALSTLFSGNLAHSLYGDRGEGLLSVAAGVLLFYALARGLTSRTRLRLFLAAATTAAALISVYGIAENYGFELISGWGNPPFADLHRSSATMGNPLTLAAYLTLMMGAATALWAGAATRLGRLAWLVALALIGACWIYAETRGALLGAGLALPIVLFAVRRRMGTVRPLVVPITVLVAAMAAAFATAMVSGFTDLSLRLSLILVSYLVFVGVFFWLLERGRARLALISVLVVLAAGISSVAAFSGTVTLSDIGATRGEASEGGDLNLRTRLYIWRDTVAMAADRPLLGHGTDNLRESSRAYMSEELKNLVRDDEGDLPRLDRAHNHTLQLAATTGLLGLAAYLWVLVSYFRNAYRHGGWALAALSGAVLAYVLQLQTAFPSVATDVAFWGLLGVSVGIMRLDGWGGEARPADSEDLPATSDRRRDEFLAEAPVGSRRSRRLGKKSPHRGELLVAGAVVVLLAAIALPTFFQQREKIAEVERTQLERVMNSGENRISMRFSPVGPVPSGLRFPHS